MPCNLIPSPPSFHLSASLSSLRRGLKGRGKATSMEMRSEWRERDSNRGTTGVNPNGDLTHQGWVLVSPGPLSGVDLDTVAVLCSMCWACGTQTRAGLPQTFQNQEFTHRGREREKSLGGVYHEWPTQECPEDESHCVFSNESNWSFFSWPLSKVFIQFQ